MLSGEPLQGLGYLAFFVSVWLGIFLGNKFADVLSSRYLGTSEDVGKRFSVAFSVFGFLFLPVLVGKFTNVNMDTDIGMASVGAHFFWACIGAAIIFCVEPANSNNSN